MPSPSQVLDDVLRALDLPVHPRRSPTVREEFLQHPEAVPERVPEPDPDVALEGEIVMANDFAFPLEVVTESLAITASRGAGKSYTTGVLVEELVANEVPVVVIDPLGVYWGLRSSADGDREGLPVVLLGGEHADAPLGLDGGRDVAAWVVSDRRPAVLDVSGMRRAEQRAFVADFAEELFERNSEPLLW